MATDPNIVSMNPTGIINPSLKTNRIVLTPTQDDLTREIKIRVDFSLNLKRPQSQSADSITQALAEMSYENLFLLFVAFDNEDFGTVSRVLQRSYSDFGMLFHPAREGATRLAQKGTYMVKVSDLLVDQNLHSLSNINERQTQSFFNEGNVEYEFNGSTEIYYRTAYPLH